MLRKLIASLSSEDAGTLSEAGGAGAVNSAKEYHSAFDQSGGWRGKRYLGAGDGSKFGASVTAGWYLRGFTRNTATIANNADHYRFKTEGGTITPKRKKFLTIPMIAEARGVMAMTYQENTGRKLFTIKGKKALFEAIPGGGVRAVYALVRSVTMQPWPKSIPADDMLLEGYVKSWKLALADMIEKA
jgi:hypothetical protein